MSSKRNLTVSAAAAVLATALAIPAVSVAVAAPPDSGSKLVRVACKPGWRGTAVGQYGGTSFSLSCDNGRATTRLSDTVGTTYSIRMGVESANGAIDCFFTGDSARVQESCAEVRLSIR